MNTGLLKINSFINSKKAFDDIIIYVNEKSNWRSGTC